MNDNFKKLPLIRLVILSALMVMTYACIKLLSHGKEMIPPKSFLEFPKIIGKWKGQEQFFSEDIYKAIGVDDSVLVNYVGPDNESVQLYVGYYRSQRKGDLIHSPKNCMPGSGWEITKNSLEPIKITPDKTIYIIKLDLEKADDKMIVLYWFQSRGRIINSEYKQKIYLVLDSIFRNRTDGSFVRIISPVNNEKPEDTLITMKQFATTLYPIINEYIPK